MNKLQKYIKKNWDSLPKSKFNNTKLVIFDCVNDEDWGWGHHSYEAYGCDKSGNIFVARSSGCSCNGSCYTEGVDYTVLPELKIKFDNYTPDIIDFDGLQTTLSDY